MPTAQDGEKGRHTETPWDYKNVVGNFEIYGGEEERLIAEIMTENDAAFIVRAVNVHDELLAAAKAVEEALNHAPSCKDSRHSMGTCPVCEARARLRSIISKSEKV